MEKGKAACSVSGRCWKAWPLHLWGHLFFNTQTHTDLDCKLRITCTHTSCCTELSFIFFSKPGCGIPFAIKITTLCGFFSFIHSLLFPFFSALKVHDFPALVKQRCTRTIILCYTCTCTACWVVINVNTGLKSNTLRKKGTAGPSHWSNWEFWAAPELGSWNTHGFASQHILNFCGRVGSFLFEVKKIQAKVIAVLYFSTSSYLPIGWLIS